MAYNGVNGTPETVETTRIAEIPVISKRNQNLGIGFTVVTGKKVGKKARQASKINEVFEETGGSTGGSNADDEVISEEHDEHVETKEETTKEKKNLTKGTEMESTKIDTKMTNKSRAIKSFETRVENLSEFLEETEKRISSIKNALTVIDPIFDGSEVSLFDIENNTNVVKKLNKVGFVEKRIPQTKEAASKLLNTLFKLCVETTQVMNKIEQFETVHNEYRIRLSSATEKLNQKKIEKFQSKYDETLDWADLVEESDDNDIVIDEESLNELKKQIKIKLPSYDDHWDLIDNKEVLKKLDAEFCSSIVGEKIEDVAKVINSEKKVPSFSQIVAMQATTPSVVRPLDFPSIERQLQKIRINYDPTANCCIKHDHGIPKYDLLVPGYIFDTFDEMRAKRSEMISSVGKFIMCRQDPNSIGIILPSTTSSNQVSIFFKYNAFGSIMGFRKTKYCPLEAQGKCRGYMYCDFYHNHEKEYFSYSPSSSGSPYLADGDNLKDIDFRDRASSECLDWMRQRNKEFKLMYCELEKFALGVIDRVKTANAMFMWEMIARFNTEIESLKLVKIKRETVFPVKHDD